MFCTGCGHWLGVGRFCTSCGRPVAADAEDTAERPAVSVPTGPPPSGPPPSGPPPSTPPPPAYGPPPPPRYPLYADELSVARAPQTVDLSTAEPSPTRRAGRSWLPWTLTVAVVVLMAVIGGMLLISGDDRAGDPSAADDTAGDPEPTSEPPGTGPAETPPPADGPQDLARWAAASAPRTAKPNQDTQGNQVHYEAANMLDEVAETCWRMPGDGTGLEITFTLPGQIKVSEVGLINGYAKSAGRLDWYAGNRRVLAVEWVFDDGTVVPQTLDQTRDLQSMPIEPVDTSTVVLRLVEVSKPGKGPSARNYTAISGVSLVGEPA